MILEINDRDLVAELDELGKMAPAGRRAFAARTPERAGIPPLTRPSAKAGGAT